MVKPELFTFHLIDLPLNYEMKAFNLKNKTFYSNIMITNMHIIVYNVLYSLVIFICGLFIHNLEVTKYIKLSLLE